MYIYLFYNNNVYYTLLYIFINFFFIGLYLAIFQIELFTAFLWLIECSVLFVFLLILFYLNIKGLLDYTYYNIYNIYFFINIYLCIIFLNFHFESESVFISETNFFYLIDNIYESVFNAINNDLFGFLLSYFLINGVEFIFVGFLLLVGSVICVNLFIINTTIRSQNYNNYLMVYSFFKDFINFFFLRKQNLIKQGNTKSSLKLFKIQ